MIQGRALKQPRQEIWMHFPTCNGWEVLVNAGRVWGKKYEVPVNVVFPYIAVSQRVLQGGTGGEGGGCSWSLWEIARRFRSCLFCGRQSQRTFKNTWGVGICIRFFTRWFYCMPYEEKIQRFILSRYFLFFIFAGTQLSSVNVQTNCKRKNVMQPAGTVEAIGIGKGMNSQVLEPVNGFW